MSERELTRLFKSIGRDIDDRQRLRIKQLKGIERTLFEELVKKLVESLSDSRGAIKTDKGSASINRLIDEVFNALDKSGLKSFQLNTIVDLNAILQATDNYYRDQFLKMSAKRYKAIRASVQETLNRSLGIGPQGQRLKGGYFDLLFKSEAMRSQIKETVNAGVNSGMPLAKLIEQLNITVKGSKEVNGTLVRYFRGHIFDTYQQFDRSVNVEYGTRLKLDTFMYQGGLIETSRKFCKDRDGKVFTLVESEKWRKSCDLPRKKDEPKCPKPVVAYNPITDLGRWNCRHRTRFMSRELAAQYRPELAEE